MDYDDEYPTCAKTDALLRIFSDDKSPSEISGFLGIEPTSSQEKGGLRNPNNPKSKSKVNCWYFGSKADVQSNDSRRHLDWVIERIYPKKKEFIELKQAGADISICCIWESSSNHGGPTIDPTQMGPLSELGIPVWWEFWYNYDTENS
ncbi:DUF4279 domain-containing protein [Marinimicrobium sp. C6131]|uniref:DUF4279 domain-containing protein n=1 Tax=Marinimicrobium sp. C6131 TaxID=3022676 RepID=UPI00223E2C88|nr:DUF4279 domain-containing protein [Marinimicrobium sp. C6131]UZJ43823.1 DUF4279 domain-containing protein [Marinimicrobium sp. C6131]